MYLPDEWSPLKKFLDKGYQSVAEIVNQYAPDEMRLAYFLAFLIAHIDNEVDRKEEGFPAPICYTLTCRDCIFEDGDGECTVVGSNKSSIRKAMKEYRRVYTTMLKQYSN